MIAIKKSVGQPEVRLASVAYGNYHENAKEMALVMTVLSRGHVSMERL